ncbi:MAG: glutamate 5-kinase [Clostridiaceae bacterium]|nr:glutamate 5-kinase [Clostridiaceae bacterium]
MTNIKTLVVKVGTSSLTHKTGFMNFKRIERLARTLCDIKNSGVRVIFVSSAAISVGMGKLGLTKRPETTKEKQAVASVGQVELMDIYSNLFSQYGVTVAQLLLTKDVLDGAERQKNALATINTLFSLGAVPIINENDTISTYEIEFGDNDVLSAHVAKLVGADLLVILTDTEGLYDSDPKRNANAKLISKVEGITDKIRSLAEGTKSEQGTGGMSTKIQAAQLATEAGIDTVISSGENPDVLYDIIQGKPRGTFFSANSGSVD